MSCVFSISFFVLHKDITQTIMPYSYIKKIRPTLHVLSRLYFLFMMKLCCHTHAIVHSSDAQLRI